MINRAAFLLKYKTPAVEWINQVGAEEGADEISLDEVNNDRTIYLIADDIADDSEKLSEWVRMNLEVLFESELDEWSSDTNLWPENRTYDQFHQWFDIECHTMLIDTIDEPIEEDGL